MILIVDDDRAIRVALTLLLERNNYEVMRAENPAEAMEVVRNHPDLELVLMDMNYTLATDGEEGLTLLKQVKVFRPDVPVILMTAWGTIDLAVQGMRNGAFDFITKPWDNGVLMDRIETAIALSAPQPPKGEGYRDALQQNGKDTDAPHGGCPPPSGAGGSLAALPLFFPSSPPLNMWHKPMRRCSSRVNRVRVRNSLLSSSTNRVEEMGSHL